MSWLDIGTLDDIPARGARRVQLGEQTVAVFRTQTNQVFALLDQCPHKQGPLSQGIIHDSCVTCPLHNWVISLETGQAQGADEGAVKTFPVEVREGRLMLFTGVSLVQAA